jgi:hypothetical protein
LKTTVFTLCSANYLAHAKTLGDSLTEHNPDYSFVIGLVDGLPRNLESSYWHPYELIPVEKLNIPDFEQMADDYNIVELNTAVKPFYIEYLYRRDPSVEVVIYLDPDILVLASFESLASKLRTYNIVLTPHLCSFDNSAANVHFETLVLTVGLYNLGFIATSRGETTFAFLDWWQKRVRHGCYYRPGSGIFVDQLWVNLAPVYFPNVLVDKDPGYNMCYWNLFERRLDRREGRYVVNEQHDLVFYHFSGYNPMRPEAPTSRGKVKASSFSERPDLKPLYDEYRSRLLSRNYSSIQLLPYSLRKGPIKSKPTVKTIVRASLRRVFDKLPRNFQKQVRLWRSARSPFI